MARTATPTSTSSMSCITTRHLNVIINPVGGGRKAKGLFNKIMAPIFDKAGVTYDVYETHHAGHATEIVTDLGATANSPNITQADGIIVVGGDGLVLEVITGLMQLSEDNRLRNIPLAIAPGGTANAYSNMLYPGDCSSRRCLARRCAYAILDGSQGHVDVMEIDNTDNEKEDKMFALSLIGWGLSGSIAKRAEKMRWMPGHRHYRYDLAGGVSLVKDWPAFGTATLRFRRPGSGDWESKEISIANFLAATVPTLGKGRPFSVDKSLDDGTVVLSMVPKIGRAHV